MGNKSFKLSQTVRYSKEEKRIVIEYLNDIHESDIPYLIECIADLLIRQTLGIATFEVEVKYKNLYNRNGLRIKDTLTD